MAGQSDPRANWLVGGPSDPDLLEEPSDSEKEWAPDQKPPAEWFNWYQDSVVKDIADIAQRILVNPSSGQAGNIASPVPLGSDGIVRDYVETSGVGSFARAFNAEYDAGNDEWTQIDSNEENPFLIIVNPSFSGITGVSSSEVDHPAGLHVFEAASMNNGVITWQLADLNAGQIDAFDVTAKNYLEPGGGVISNNGTNPNTQIDNTAIELWVRDFSGGGRIVELPARSPAFDITVDGFNGTTGGLINGSSRNQNDWYEKAVIASESDDTLDPIVVGYTIGSVDNTPTSASDLPGNYDLFRPMGDEGLTWVFLTDGNSDLFKFQHFSNGELVIDPVYRENNFSNLLDDGSPPNSSTSHNVSAQVPPGKYEVKLSGVEVITDSGALAILAISNTQVSSSKFGEIRVGHDTDNASNNFIATDSMVITGQTIEYATVSASQATINHVVSIRGVK